MDCLPQEILFNISEYGCDPPSLSSSYLLNRLQNICPYINIRREIALLEISQTMISVHPKLMNMIRDIKECTRRSNITLSNLNKTTYEIRIYSDAVRPSSIHNCYFTLSRYCDPYDARRTYITVTDSDPILITIHNTPRRFSVNPWLLVPSSDIIDDILYQKTHGVNIQDNVIFSKSGLTVGLIDRYRTLSGSLDQLVSLARRKRDMIMNSVIPESIACNLMREVVVGIELEDGWIVVTHRRNYNINGIADWLRCLGLEIGSIETIDIHRWPYSDTTFKLSEDSYIDMMDDLPGVMSHVKIMIAGSVEVINF